MKRLALIDKTESDKTFIFECSCRRDGWPRVVEIWAENNDEAVYLFGILYPNMCYARDPYLKDKP